MLAAQNKINRSPELYSLTMWNTEKVTIVLGFPVDSFYLLLNFRWNHTACSWCMVSYHYIMMFMHKVYSYVLPCTAFTHQSYLMYVTQALCWGSFPMRSKIAWTTVWDLVSKQRNKNTNTNFQPKVSSIWYLDSPFSYTFPSWQKV